jgi:membrane-associated phospholipid phosphatase
MKHACCLLLSLAAVAPLAAAEEPAKPNRRSLGERWSNGARHLGQDARYLVTFPGRPTKRGWAKTGAVMGGVVLLMLFDDEIREEVQEARNDTLDRWERRIEPLGKGEMDALGSLLVYLGGRLAKSERVAGTGRALLESLLFTQAATTSTKGLFGRNPPGGGARGSEWFEEGTVFPSGHTSRAFAVATVLAERHGRAAAWTGYSLATLVGLFRLESDSHWASDVLAGAALGHGIARAVTRRRAERERPRTDISFVPTWSPTRRSVGFVLRIAL